MRRRTRAAVLAASVAAHALLFTAYLVTRPAPRDAEPPVFQVELIRPQTPQQPQQPSNSRSASARPAVPTPHQPPVLSQPPTPGAPPTPSAPHPLAPASSPTRSCWSGPGRSRTCTNSTRRR